MVVIVAKILCIILLIFLVACIANLFKVFEKLPEKGLDRSWVAFGLLAELILIIELSVKLITG